MDENAIRPDQYVSYYGIEIIESSKPLYFRIKLGSDELLFNTKMKINLKCLA